MLAPEILSPVDTFGSTDQSFKSVPRVMRKSSLAVCFIFSLMQWIFYHLLNFWWFLPNYSVLNGEGWWFKSNWPYRLMRFSPNALKKKKRFIDFISLWDDVHLDKLPILFRHICFNIDLCLWSQDFSMDLYLFRLL